MNIASYNVALSALVFSTVVCGAAAVAAQPGQTVEQALQTRILTNMRMPRPMMGQRAPEGIARISFTVGDDGRAHDVAISKRSGSTMIDREAVRMITAFRDLPAGRKGDKVYAVLQYRTSGDQWDAAPAAAFASQVALAHANASAARLAALEPTDKSVASLAAPTEAPLLAQATMAKVAYSDVSAPPH